MAVSNNFEVTARLLKDVYARHKQSGQELNLQLFLLGKCVSCLKSNKIIDFDGWKSAAVKVSSPKAILELLFTREGKVLAAHNSMQ